MAGALGSLFVSVNTWMGYLRKRIIKNNSSKIIETGMFGFATISVMSIIVISFNECKRTPICYDCNTQAKWDDYHKEIDQFIEWDCDENFYSPLATLFFNTEGGTIKTLFKKSKYFDITAFDLALFGAVWYIFTIITYGVFIPAGLFLPGIIMGGAMGRLWGYFIQYLFNYTDSAEIE